MTIASVIPTFRKFGKQIDWKLLLFLLLFLDVKIVVKLAAIIIIYALQFDYQFGFRLKNSRLPLFYVWMIAIGALNWVVYKGFTIPGYNVAFLTGALFWVFCILAVHQVKLFVEKNDPATIHRTILVFFIINTVVTFFTLACIIWEIKEPNPYLYQGQYQKYFISTGDYIKGITFDVSTTNAILNAFGVVYFLSRKKIVMLLLCMIVLLLATSNFTNLALLIVFFFLFIFKSDREQKSLIVICIAMLVLFMAKISPQNDNYSVSLYNKIFNREAAKDPVFKPKPVPLRERPDSVLTTEEKKQKKAILYLDSLKTAESQPKQVQQPVTLNKKPVAENEQKKPIIPGDSIHTPHFQSRRDTTAMQAELISYAASHKAELVDTPKTGSPLPGKVISFKQTVHFFKKHPKKIFTGDGIGNFSSKLAFRATGLKMSGSYPEKYIYVNKDFLANHLDVYLFYFSKNAKFHSIVNYPGSVYDQVLTEYGLVGVAAFIICYLWFFWKQRKKLTYGIPLFMLLLAVFCIEYWFEQLSIVVFFELMIFLNIKETEDKAGR